VPKGAPGTGTARTTFTATAAGRVQDSDPVDVQAQESVTGSPPRAVPTEGALTAAHQEWTVAGVLGEGASGPVQIRIETAAGALVSDWAASPVSASVPRLNREPNAYRARVRDGAQREGAVVSLPAAAKLQGIGSGGSIRSDVDFDDTPGDRPFRRGSGQPNNLDGVSDGTTYRRPGAGYVDVSGRVSGIYDDETGVHRGGGFVGGGASRARTGLNGSGRVVTGVEPTADVAGRTASAVRDEARTGREGVGTLPAELVRNGGGQEGDPGVLATGWLYGGGNYSLVPVEGDGKFGGRALQMGGPVASDSSSYQLIALGTGRVYELRGWIKVHDVHAPSGYAMLDLFSSDGDGAFQVLESSAPYVVGLDIGVPCDVVRDWTEVRVVFRATLNTTLSLSVRVGYGGNAQSTCRFDGISLRQVSDSYARSLITISAPGRLASGVRGRGDFSVGDVVPWGVNRHTETKSVAASGNAVTFDAAYDSIPQVDAYLSKGTGPGAGKYVVEAYDVTVSGCKLRAVAISGETATAYSENFASSLNGAESGTGVLLSADGAAAFSSLDNATTVSTTYTVTYNVNTTNLNSSNVVIVEAYVNDGASSTAWSLKAQDSWGNGVNVAGAQLSFNAALGAGYDVRLLIRYNSAPGLNTASVRAMSVAFNAITAGTESALAGGGTDRIVCTATEAP
jgi:hypothetical protein